MIVKIIAVLTVLACYCAGLYGIYTGDLAGGSVLLTAGTLVLAILWDVTRKEDDGERV
jgi:hypothetical protein